MNDADVDFDQGRLLGLARRHLLLVVLSGLVGVLLAGAQLFRAGLPYTSETQILVGDTLTVQSLLSDTPTSRDQGRLVDSEQRRLESDQVTSAVDAALPNGHRAYSAKLSSGTTTNVITVDVTSADPAVAQAAAAAYGTVYLKALADDNAKVIAAAEAQLATSVKGINDQLAKLEAALSSATDTSLAKVQAIVAPVRTSLLDQKATVQRQLDQIALVKSVNPTGGARVIQPATPATTSMVATAFPLAAGLLLGLLAGVGLLWLRELWGGRVVDAADLTATGLEPRSVWPVPVVLPTKDTPGARPTTSEVISLRGVASTMWPPRRAGAPGHVTLVAPIDRDPAAASALSVWLGEQLSGMRRTVVLVNTDAELPLADRYPPVSLPVRQGLVESGVLASVRTVTEEFRLLDAFGAKGPAVGDPAFTSMLTALSNSFDVVLVNGPGLMTAAESIQVAPLVNRVLLLARSGRTRRKTVGDLVHLFGGHAHETTTLQHPDVVIHGTRTPRWLRSQRAAPAVGAVADPGADAV